jgi:hypothetical protein
LSVQVFFVRRFTETGFLILIQSEEGGNRAKAEAEKYDLQNVG